MLIRRYFVGIEEICLFLILFSTTPSDAQTTPPGHCVIHFHDPDGQTFGSRNIITAKRTRNEADEVGTVTYQVTWDDGGLPGDIQGDLFNEYCDVDSSVPNSWKITLKKALTGLPDYPEVQDTLTAISTFTGFTGFPECDFTLTIPIEDANTQTPESEENPYTVSIREDFPVGFDVTDLNVNIRDNDFSEPNNIIDVTVDADCHLIPNPTKYKDFIGDFKRVNFQLSKALDFEVEPNLFCYVTVTDQGVDPLSKVITVEIRVDDIQDEPPIFTSIIYSAVVDFPEPAEGGTPLYTDPKPIKATDGDTGLTSKITYSMDDYTPEIFGTDYFTIDSESGVVKLMKLLDEDMLKNEKVIFALKATDESGESATSVLQVTLPPVPMTTQEPITTPSTTPTITSTASTTSSPQPAASLSFTQDSYAADIFPSSSTVLTVDVNVEGIDREDVVFSLDDLATKYFVIESPSGEIQVQEPPEVGTYVITATANATAPAGQHLEDNATVHIKVLTSFAEVTDA